MTKKYFAVSTYRDIWQKNISALYIIEPYVRHFLELKGLLRDYDSVEIAPLGLLSIDDIKLKSRYVDAKYEKYIRILTKRLNAIHGTCHPEPFWKKALSMAFIRYITIFHDLFSRCELFFDYGTHTCNVISNRSYFIPLDFEDHRFFFQNTDYGQEQIFSIYIKLFYPDQFDEVHQTPEQFDKKILKDGLKKKNVCFDNGFKCKIKTLYNFAHQVYAIARRRTRAKKNKVCIGLVGTYFSPENLNTLLLLSKNKIHPIDWSISYSHENIPASWEKRKILSEYEDDFDKFDNFFFSSLTHCFPRAFVEHYSDIERLYIDKLGEYKSLAHIISEGWIADTYISIFLALGQEKEIKHITNEHNGFLHPFEGSFLSHAIDMSDTFVSLGWSDSKHKNFISGASLFPFSIHAPRERKYNILYISGPVVVKIPHYSSAWGGYGGINSGRYIEFIKTFFENLSGSTLKEITYRRYPNWADIPLMNYDKEYCLASYLKNIGCLAEMSTSAKVQMLQANIVIVDYISCSYLESMVMNIPTVFFWNPETFYFKDEYSDFFKPLLDVGICQKNPVEAAEFIENISYDPEKWWFNDETQEGKNEFLNRNFGKPEVMINYLLGLLK